MVMYYESRRGIDMRNEPRTYHNLESELNQLTILVYLILIIQLEAGVFDFPAAIMCFIDRADAM